MYLNSFSLDFRILSQGRRRILQPPAFAFPKETSPRRQLGECRPGPQRSRLAAWGLALGALSGTRRRLVDLPAQEHGIVFVHSVVAMLHEHAAEVAELHSEGDTAPWPQPIDVLAALLPCRYVAGAAVAGEDLALLKVDVDRVIPAAAAIFQGPDFAGPVVRRR